jgi:hypothetical protein
MADITVVAKKVAALPGAICRFVTLGGNVNVGDVVYMASDGDAEVADGDAGTGVIEEGRGIVLSVGGEGKESGVAGERASICLYGPVAGFSGMTPGDGLYVSDTAGKLADAAGANEWAMGFAYAADVVFVNPQVV